VIGQVFKLFYNNIQFVLLLWLVFCRCVEKNCTLRFNVIIFKQYISCPPIACPTFHVLLFHVRHHRLNGSSSPVLTATSLSYGKAKNSTPHRIKTPDLIEIKFGTVDYVGEMTPHAKFHVNPSKGAYRQMGEIYAKIFIAVHIPFFRNSPTGQTLQRIFACNGSNDAVSRKDVPFGG